MYFFVYLTLIEEVLEENPSLKTFTFGEGKEDFKFDPIFLKNMEENMLMHSKMITLHEKMDEINEISFWSLFDDLFVFGLCSNSDRLPCQDPLRL